MQITCCHYWRDQVDSFTVADSMVTFVVFAASSFAARRRMGSRPRPTEVKVFG